MKNKTILLLLMPYWDPLLPPMGLSCLKSYLQAFGFSVKTLDANPEPEFYRISDNYFAMLKEFIPADKAGNFFSVGKEVLRNHLAAHLNQTDPDQYAEFVGELVYRNFYYSVSTCQVLQLSGLAAEFYSQAEEYLTRHIKAEKPAVLGISVFQGTVAASLFAFKLAKELLPGIETVMGGGVFADQLAVGSPDWEIFLKKTAAYIDKIFIGEGERLFLKYLKGELQPGKRVYSAADIPGTRLDLTQAAVPDFSDFNVAGYPYVGAYVSRGCPFRCNFCSETVRWGRFRKKDADQVVRELKELYERHGSRLFMMSDSLLNFVIDELAEALLKENVPFYWDGYLRVTDRVCDLENTQRWRRGGFYRARLGIESGSDHVLRLMNKEVTRHQIEETLMSLAHAGIKTTTYWVVGYPGETEEDFTRTLQLLEEMSDFIYEADPSVFRYYICGQVGSTEWSKKSKPLYPDWAGDMLILRQRVVDCAPSRELSYERLRRFTGVCRRLGIANPYSLQDIHLADERWRTLHRNAVPPLIAFKNNHEDIGECREVKKPGFAKNESPGRAAAPFLHGAAAEFFPRARRYWLERFSGYIPAIPLSAAGKNPGTEPPGSHPLRICGDSCARLMNLSEGSDHRLHVLLFTAVVIFIYKYSQRKDVAAGIPILKQDSGENFINTLLPIRCPVADGMTVEELMKQARRYIEEAYCYQNYPVERIAYYLGIPCETGQVPLIDILVVLENIHHQPYSPGKNIDLIFSFARKDTYIDGLLECRSPYYSQSDITRASGYFINIVRQAFGNPDITVSGIGMLSEEEKLKILSQANEKKEADEYEFD